MQTSSKLPVVNSVEVQTNIKLPVVNSVEVQTNMVQPCSWVDQGKELEKEQEKAKNIKKKEKEKEKKEKEEKEVAFMQVKKKLQLRRWLLHLVLDHPPGQNLLVH